MPANLSKLANEAYAIGASKLGKRLQEFSIVTFAIPDPHFSPQMRKEVRKGYVTYDNLCAVHFEEPISRWNVTMLRSGLVIADCRTHHGATALIGLIYIDPFLSEVAQINDPTIARNSTNDQAKRQIVQTAYARTMCCVDNRLDELV